MLFLLLLLLLLLLSAKLIPSFLINNNNNNGAFQSCRRLCFHSRHHALLGDDDVKNTNEQQQSKQLLSYVPSNIFIGGLGYVGSRLASAFHDAYPSARISGTVRSTERRDGLLASTTTKKPSWLTGDVHVLDIDNSYIGLDSNGVDDLLNADTIIQTVAPIADFDRDPILAFHGDSLSSSSSALQYVAYISSTGVYGNHDGEWVDEEDDAAFFSDESSVLVLRCTDAKSLARIQAEKEWGKLERCNKEEEEEPRVPLPRVDCFRCGGIYGPGRGPLFSSLESLTEAAAATMTDDTQNTDLPVKYVNRIIVDDICSAILCGVGGKRPFYSGGRAYNLVDDDPAPRRAVVAEARRLILLKDNPAGDATTTTTVSPTATKNTRRRISRGTGNKRCRNTRLKTEYKWTPTAPTFREGLASLL